MAVICRCKHEHADHHPEAPFACEECSCPGWDPKTVVAPASRSL